MKDDRSETTVSGAIIAGHGGKIHLMLLFGLRQFSSFEVSATARALLPLPGSTGSQTKI